MKTSILATALVAGAVLGWTSAAQAQSPARIDGQYGDGSKPLNDCSQISGLGSFRNNCNLTVSIYSYHQGILLKLTDLRQGSLWIDPNFDPTKNVYIVCPSGQAPIEQLTGQSARRDAASIVCGGS